MSQNKDLENYLLNGTLPPCSCCHRKEGVKAKLEYDGDVPYLSWLCEDCLDCGEQITPSYVCPMCNKPFDRENFYLLNGRIFCSKDCALEYEGYFDIDTWESLSDEYKENTGKGIHIS